MLPPSDAPADEEPVSPPPADDGLVTEEGEPLTINLVRDSLEDPFGCGITDNDNYVQNVESGSKLAQRNPNLRSCTCLILSYTLRSASPISAPLRCGD